MVVFDLVGGEGDGTTARMAGHCCRGGDRGSEVEVEVDDRVDGIGDCYPQHSMLVIVRYRKETTTIILCLSIIH